MGPAGLRSADRPFSMSHVCDKTLTMAIHQELSSSVPQTKDATLPPDLAQVLLAVARMIAAYRTGRYDDVSPATLALLGRGTLMKQLRRGTPTG